MVILGYYLMYYLDYIYLVEFVEAVVNLVILIICHIIHESLFYSWRRNFGQTHWLSMVEGEYSKPLLLDKRIL